MIVGGYSLDLYCDDPQHAERHPNKFTSLDAQYVGQTESDCRKQARKDGWRFDLVNNTCQCKDCRD